MKSSTRLESVVFQLTPTRTRCELVIHANGKNEKIASGLLNPFLAHLKTAQDQMAKGGYSIILQIEPGMDATWFTKGTVERFVRFVSTPEILERVYTIELEILQIEEAIAIQSNNNMGLSVVEDHQSKPVESIEGSRPIPDHNEEKAIVLYTPGAQPSEANRSTTQEENSKVQLLKVLETRKGALQKEQGMAFARAVAASFDIDNMVPLISFAESFGASRLRDACLRFTDLWKKKHETGQWLEIEATEAMSNRSDFAMNASGIVFSNIATKEKGLREECPENNGKGSIDTSTDEKPSMDHQSPGHHEYFQGQFPHPMFPPWPIHSPPGIPPAFQGYPMQGIPYYQNYPGSSSFFQQPFSPMDDPRLNSGHRIGQKRHSMDSRDSHTGSEIWEAEKARSHDDLELGNEASQSQEPRKRHTRSDKKKSGKVVIRNINYITSKRQDSSDGDSESSSGSETDEEDEDQVNSSKGKHNKSSSTKKGRQTRSIDILDSASKEERSHENEADVGHWQAFQSYLLRDAEREENLTNQGMFEMEKKVHARRRLNTMDEDPLASNVRNINQFEEGNSTDMRHISSDVARMRKASKDESLMSRRTGHSNDGSMFLDGQVDLESSEMGGGRRYRRISNDEFMTGGWENLSGSASSLDPLARNGHQHSVDNLERKSPHDVNDDSFIVPFRSTSKAEVGSEGRNAIDIYSEFPSPFQNAENVANRIDSQVNYEPDDLSMMPERGMEKRSTGYDPALDYEMQAQTQSATLHKQGKGETNDGKLRSKQTDKDRKSKPTPDSDRRKSVGPIRKGKPSKLSPLDEARARADKLRSFKADLQKMKKEKEEAERKRLEALKIERQKRIAAKGSSVSAQSPAPSLQTKRQLPSKLSPGTHKGSKFSDSEPGSSSPLQRTTRTASLVSADPHKVSKPSKLSTGTHSTGNRFSRSASSMPEVRKEGNGVTPEAKVSMARIRRLSEPRISSSPHMSSQRGRNSEPSLKHKASTGPEVRKMSEIVTHDKSKIASLPELKIRTSMAPNASHSKSGAKELNQKVKGSKSLKTETTELNKNKDKASPHIDVDDSMIIEKTVVTLENEKPSTHSTTAVKKEHNDISQTGRKTDVVSGYVAIRAPVSPVTLDGLNEGPAGQQLRLHTRANEVKSGNTVTTEELPNSSSAAVNEKPYQAPYARVSSLEDPCTEKSDYSRAPPTGIQVTATEKETVKALVSEYRNLKLDKVPEALDKTQKESSKGFRRLLKFGKKHHGSATSDRNTESDNASVNGLDANELFVTTASSSEVHTLKNLISQDETPTAGSTPQKPSRHFSLLSPFRSKTSEKKSS